MKACNEHTFIYHVCYKTAVTTQAGTLRTIKTISLFHCSFCFGCNNKMLFFALSLAIFKFQMEHGKSARSDNS